MEILIVVDMQNDFIDGALGTKEAEEIVPRVVEISKKAENTVFCIQEIRMEKTIWKHRKG